MIAIPSSVDDLTAAWLTEVLQNSGATTGTVASLAVEPVGVGVGVVGELFRLTPTYTGGGGPATVVAKVSSTKPEARIVGQLLALYEKEIRFYQELAADTAMGTPNIYCADIDIDSQNSIVVMEDLAGYGLADQLAGCSLADAELAVAELARLHASWWDSPALSGRPWLAPVSASPFPEALAFAFSESWEPAQERFGHLLPGPVKAFGDRFGDVLPDLLNQLSKGPVSLSHGDYRLENLFFTGDPAKPLVVVDWQLASVAKPARDIAYFLTQSLTPDMRAGHEQALIAHYLDELAAGGVEGFGYDQLFDDYRLASLFMLCYPLVAGGKMTDDKRGVALCQAMIERSVAAVVDLNCLDLVEG